MESSYQLSYRNMTSSKAIEQNINKKLEKLHQVCNKITHCNVMIEAPHEHSVKGKHYHIRLDISVPGNEIVVNRHPTKHAAHEDIYVAIRDAFDAAKRQLRSFMQRKRGEVKTHAQVNSTGETEI